MLVQWLLTYLSDCSINLFLKFDLHERLALVHVVVTVVLYVVAGTAIAKHLRYLSPLVTVLTVQEEQSPTFCLGK